MLTPDARKAWEQEMNTLPEWLKNEHRAEPGFWHFRRHVHHRGDLLMSMIALLKLDVSFNIRVLLNTKVRCRVPPRFCLKIDLWVFFRDSISSHKSLVAGLSFKIVFVNNIAAGGLLRFASSESSSSGEVCEHFDYFDLRVSVQCLVLPLNSQNIDLCCHLMEQLRSHESQGPRLGFESM